MLEMDQTFDNIISIGFKLIDKENKGYITPVDIKNRYQLSDNKLNIILKHFDPQKTNMIKLDQFTKIFKYLISELY